MTDKLFLDDSSLREASATVAAVLPGGVVLDRTPFYARGGGQPGDTGALIWTGGTLAVTEAVKGDDGTILHPVAGEPPPPGAIVSAVLDWERRLAHMRMHTTLHLLCALLPGAAVTGGQVGAEKSRLDFDLPDAPDREQIEAGLAALIAADHRVTAEWVDESVLDTNPGLVRTLSVKPPRGTGRLRLVRIGDIDLQPCGGTHVGSTAQIGTMRVLKIENKGRQNRRISLALGA
jgi:misacylated tRNA(Ala) deacylase